MTVVGAIIICAAWAAYFAYWFISGRSAAKAETVRRSGGNFAWLAGLVVVVVLLALFGYHLHIAEPVLQPLGVAVTVAGAALSAWARRELGRHWNPNVAIVEGQELVTSGPYRYVRHPIYTGFILMALGSAVFIQEPAVLVIAVLLAASLVAKARDEESLLASHYDAYAAYRARTAALVPFVY
ncbi:MAG: methyltransferase family protein [Hyphomicrobiales bacterium]